MERSSPRHSSASHSLLVFLCQHMLSLILLSSALVDAKVPENVTIPALFAFGDSIVDQGNNNHIWTIGKCNFPPYGDDFVNSTPTGRFSNGKTPADLIANEFGIKELLPAYLDPNLKDEDLLTGVSFASGTTGLDPQTSRTLSVLSMTKQLELFKEYIGKLKGIVGEEGTKDILQNSLFLVVIGSNDLAITYFDIGIRKLRYNINSYTDFLAQLAFDFLKGLYKLGARRIAVHSIPPVGCVPAQRTLAGGIERKCAESQNEATQLLNAKLLNTVNSIQIRLSDSKARVFFVDLYNPVLDIIQNHKKYGFTVVDRGCCGTGGLEAGILCNRLSPTCSDHSKYLFWDSFHPTERGYRVMIGKILQTYINNLQN